MSINEGDTCSECGKGTLSYYGPRINLIDNVENPGDTYQERGYQCNNPQCRKKFHNIQVTKETQTTIKDPEDKTD